MLQKPIPHSINNRLAGIKAEKYGPRLTTSANSFYASRRKKDKLKPKWEGPFIIDEVLTGAAYRLRGASDNRLEPNP